ncbi:MAG: family 20 glycosylhydrolase, partial [Verrucomicrobiota bacterium]
MASPLVLPFPSNPRFERRGLMLDISRNRVPTMAWLKWLIDRLAILRFNELQLYMEHSFAYSAHETVWKEASPMTAHQIKEIDLYSAARGIELVPNQNSFGHMERWLKHDAYRPLAECPDGFMHPIAGWKHAGSTLYPSEGSAAFIDSLYTELLPNFQATMLHIGGDEPWELGQGRSQQAVAGSGKHAVYLGFLQKLFQLASKHGRQSQFWADIVLERPDLVAALPSDVLPVIWGYEADSPFNAHCKTVAGAGFGGNFYVAPGAGSWNSFSGRLDVAAANIANAADAAASHGAKGILLTAWGDNGHHQPTPTLYTPLLLTALEAWGIRDEITDLASLIDAIFYPENAPGNGAALLAMGQIDSLLPQPAPPNSFLHSALFADPDTLA